MEQADLSVGQRVLSREGSSSFECCLDTTSTFCYCCLSSALKKKRRKKKKKREFKLRAGRDRSDRQLCIQYETWLDQIFIWRCLSPNLQTNRFAVYLQPEVSEFDNLAKKYFETCGASVYAASVSVRGFGKWPWLRHSFLFPVIPASLMTSVMTQVALFLSLSLVWMGQSVQCCSHGCLKTKNAVKLSVYSTISNLRCTQVHPSMSLWVQRKVSGLPCFRC